MDEPKYAQGQQFVFRKNGVEKLLFIDKRAYGETADKAIYFLHEVGTDKVHDVLYQKDLLPLVESGELTLKS